MKNILPSALDYLNSSTRAFIANLVKIELKDNQGSTYLYLTDYSRDIVFQGAVYATGKIKRISSVKQSTTLSINSLTISITGAIQEEVLRFINGGSKILGSKVEIWQAHLDPNTGEIIPFTVDNTPAYYFKGKISGGDLTDSLTPGTIGSSTINWTCSNDFFDFEKVNGRLTSDASHRALESVGGVLVPSDSVKRPEYKSDKGFLYADRSVSVLAKYQTKELRYRMKSKRKSGLGGLVGLKNYSMEEYYANVTREVDLTLDLTSQYIPIVYGVRKVPGIPIFVDTENDNPNSVWVIYAVCEGEIEGFLDIYIDDKPLICLDDADDEARVCFGRKRSVGNTMQSYASNSSSSAASVHGQEYVYEDDDGTMSFWTYHGLPNQIVSTVIKDRAAILGFKIQNELGYGPEYWDDSMMLLDTAYVVMNIKLSEDRDSIPSIDFEVEGKKVAVYTNSISPPDTSKTSLNLSWQLLDYLTSSRYGPNIPLTDLVLSSFLDVANLFNTQDTSYQVGWVPFWRYLGWKDQSASNRSIIQTNVILDSSTTIFKNIESLLNQGIMALPIFDGKYYLTAERNIPAIYALSNKDIIDGSIKVSDTTGREKYNSTVAAIEDPASSWNSKSVTFFNSQYLQEDNGVDRKLNLVFSYITNYYTARSLSERELKKSRYSRSIEISLPYTFIGILPNDFIKITYPRYEWVEKLFKVTEVEQDSTGKINLGLTEFSLDALITSGQSDISDSQSPVSENLLPPRNLQYIPEPKNQNTSKNGTLSWNASLSPGVAYYSIKYSGNVDSFTVLVDSNYTENTLYSFDLYNLPAGVYTFDVRAVTLTGKRSKVASITVNLDPSKNLRDITGFKVTNLANGSSSEFVGGFINIVWDRSDDEDIINNLTYNLQIFNSTGTLLRDLSIAKGTYTYQYSLASMKSDYTMVMGGIGIYRNYTLRIKARGTNGEESVSWTNIT